MVEVEYRITWNLTVLSSLCSFWFRCWMKLDQRKIPGFPQQISMLAFGFQKWWGQQNVESKGDRLQSNQYHGPNAKSTKFLHWMMGLGWRIKFIPPKRREKDLPRFCKVIFKSVSMSHIVGMSDIWRWQPESFTLARLAALNQRR